jgi:class 3 adenylate cyclase
MTEVVFEHEGTLDKFIGDAIMAFWGAPLTVENPVHKAVACALKMQARLDELNKKWALEGKPPIQVGYGINTGECIVGNIGSEQRMEYTAIGDMVNTTARIEGESLGGQLLVTEDVLKELGDQCKFKKLDPVQLKGKSQKHAYFPSPESQRLTRPGWIPLSDCRPLSVFVRLVPSPRKPDRLLRGLRRIVLRRSTGLRTPSHRVSRLPFNCLLL